VTGVGRSIGAAISGNRPLEDFELLPIVTVGLLLGAVAIVGFIAPRLLAWPLAVLTAWTAMTFLVEAWAVWRRRPPAVSARPADPAPALQRRPEKVAGEIEEAAQPAQSPKP